MPEKKRRRCIVPASFCLAEQSRRPSRIAVKAAVAATAVGSDIHAFRTSAGRSLPGSLFHIQGHAADTAEQTGINTSG